MNSLFGLSHNATLLVCTLVVIVFLVTLIAKYKWNPFVTLLLSALSLGLLAGMKYQDLIKSYYRWSWRHLGYDCHCHRPWHHAGKNDGRIRRRRTHRHYAC
ncbi:hypothetical protein PUR_01320 [Paenibacillus sp. URB8-2]|nr:hypothetical protein PUR_01320 [Paenibacillus sp. URB8-2]